jgi:hypothetical protein
MRGIKLFVAAGYLLCMGFSSFGQQAFIGKPNPTAISKALESVQTIHTLSVWELARLSGENEFKLLIDAVEYKATNQTEVIKSLRFNIVGKESAESDLITKSYMNTTSYVEDNEYALVIVAIDNMMKDMKDRKSQKKFGEMNYITKGGIKIGYVYNSSKMVAYVSIIAGQIEVSNESASPDDFFETLKQQFDIASKELYLPENAEKLKKAKKGSGEAKDVNINDL